MLALLGLDGVGTRLGHNVVRKYDIFFEVRQSQVCGMYPLFYCFTVDHQVLNTLSDTPVPGIDKRNAPSATMT